MRIILLLSFLFVSVSVFAQKNVKVNVYAKGYEPEEPSIYINPTNPDNIIAGANLDNYYYSFDGGKTWDESKLPGPTVWGDPVLHFDYLGNAYYTHLGTFDNTGIYIARSMDGGRSWSNSKRIHGYNGRKPFQDKEWIVSDSKTPEYLGYLYVSWTEFDQYNSKNPEDSSRILFSRSTDGGDSFTYPIKINDLNGDSRDGDSTVEGAVPCVGPNGEVYVAWSGPRGIEFDRSIDGGITFNEDVWVCDQVGGWSYSIPGLYRCNGLPFTACDISGGDYNGNIYINFSDSRNGDHDVFIVRSTDGGSTWSDVIRVNDDVVGNGKEQFMSHMCVDPLTGVMYILYYDRRNYNDLKTDVYLAISRDGGQTFANEKVSDTPFVPNSKVFFGDYIGINAYNNFYSAIWMRMDDGDLSLMNYSNTLE
ncbi:glycosyl hydrolase [Candidatus Saccharibacteria bacterium]|nr:glycosyl hydrolase [Candidatus Saccharibacteria bacterium]